MGCYKRNVITKGGNSTLVSEIATQTLTNKTIGVGQLTCNTAYTGDGSTVAFTITNGHDSTKCFGVYQWCSEPTLIMFLRNNINFWYRHCIGGYNNY